MRETVREHLTGERWKIPQEDVGVRGAAGPSCCSSKLKFDDFKLTQCTATEVTSRLPQWESGVTWTANRKVDLRGQSVPDPDEAAWNSLQETEGGREEFEAGWVGALSSLFTIHQRVVQFSWRDLTGYWVREGMGSYRASALPLTSLSLFQSQKRVKGFWLRGQLCPFMWGLEWAPLPLL